jgi:hypothetical protein
MVNVGELDLMKVENGPAVNLLESAHLILKCSESPRYAGGPSAMVTLAKSVLGGGCHPGVKTRRLMSAAPIYRRRNRCTISATAQKLTVIVIARESKRLH